MSIPFTRCENSSNVAGFEYDDATKTLGVEFRNGGKYRYAGVDASIAEGLKTSKSVGRDVGAIAKAIKGVKAAE